MIIVSLLQTDFCSVSRRNQFGIGFAKKIKQSLSIDCQSACQVLSTSGFLPALIDSWTIYNGMQTCDHNFSMQQEQKAMFCLNLFLTISLCPFHHWNLLEVYSAWLLHSTFDWSKAQVCASKLYPCITCKVPFTDRSCACHASSEVNR